jgi:dTDP-4-dehydrorhamnose reductase
MRIGVTGPRGRLGAALVAAGCEAIAADITLPPAQLGEAIPIGLDAIVNAAAYSDVDGAEGRENRERAVLVNTRGPGNVRRAFGGLLLHISTGYVFGNEGPYQEDAVPSPLNFYGMTKLGGEAAALVRQPTLIVRTLDLYGPGERSDFVRRTRDQLELGMPVEMPANQFVTPTYIPHLVEALLWLAEAFSGRLDLSLHHLHVAGDATISRFAWCQAIAEAFGADPALVRPTDKPWGTAMRPLRGGLLVDRAKAMNVPIYGPQEGLKALREAEGDSP